MDQKVLPFSLSVSWWIAVAIEVGTVGNVPGLATKAAHGFILNAAGVGVHFALMALLVVAVTLIYARRAPSSSSVRFAAALVGVGLVLDVVLTAPLFVGSFSAYFGKATVWIGYALAFATAIITATVQRTRFAPEASTR